jgi:hypothetical protein
VQLLYNKKAIITSISSTTFIFSLSDAVTMAGCFFGGRLSVIRVTLSKSLHPVLVDISTFPSLTYNKDTGFKPSRS